MSLREKCKLRETLRSCGIGTMGLSDSETQQILQTKRMQSNFLRRDKSPFLYCIIYAEAPE